MQNWVCPGEMGMNRAAILRKEKWNVAHQRPVVIVRANGKNAKTPSSRKGKISLSRNLPEYLCRMHVSVFGLTSN